MLLLPVGGWVQSVGGEHYDPPQLATRLHKVCHYDRHFHCVNATFDPERWSTSESRYTESLVMATLPFLLLALLVLLSGLGVTVYACWRRKRPTDGIVWNVHTERKRRRSLLVLLVLTILVGILAGVALAENGRASNSLSTGIQRVSHLGTTLHKSMQHANTLLVTASNSSLVLYDIHDILEEDDPSMAEQALQIGQDIEEELEDTQHLVDELQSADTKFSNNYPETRSTVRDIDYSRQAVVISFVVTSIIGIVLGLFGACSRSKTMAKFAIGLVYTSIVIILLITALHFPLSVSTSDACVGTDDYVKDVARRHRFDEYVTFYIDCSGSNPVIRLMDHVAEDIGQAQEYLAILEQKLDQYPAVKPDFEQLEKSVALGEDTLNVMRHLLACSSLNRPYTKAKESTCSEIVPGLFSVFVSSLLLGIVLAVSSVAIHKASRIMGHAPVDDDDGESLTEEEYLLPYTSRSSHAMDTPWVRIPMNSDRNGGGTYGSGGRSVEHLLGPGRSPTRVSRQSPPTSPYSVVESLPIPSVYHSPGATCQRSPLSSEI